MTAEVVASRRWIDYVSKLGDITSRSIVVFLATAAMLWPRTAAGSLQLGFRKRFIRRARLVIVQRKWHSCPNKTLTHTLGASRRCTFMVKALLERNARCLSQPINHHSVKCSYYCLASLHRCNTKLFYSVLASTINWQHVQGEPRLRPHTAGPGSSTPECTISGDRQWIDGFDSISRRYDMKQHT